MKASNCVRVVLVFMVALFLAQSVFACDCTVGPSVEKAKAIFSGKVVEVNKSETKIVAYRFWKGVVQRTVVLISSQSMCSYYFKKDKEYLVYAYGDKRLSTSICTRTKELSQAKEDLAELGEGTEATESDEK